MTTSTSLTRWLYATLAGLLATASAAQAQSPTVIRASLAPAANARTVSRSTTVAVPFSQTIDPATAGNIKVFSQQYRGRRTATASTSGSTVTLTPTVPATGSQVADFKPGETVLVTVPATVQSTGAVAATKYVYQFTAAATGGSGNFTAPATNPDPGVDFYPYGVAAGDVDGDGDLDFVAINNSANAVSVRLNNGSGNFTAPATNPEPAVGSFPLNVALGDVDGDGDLDLLATNGNSNTVSVRLNNGSGNFTAPATNPNPAVGTHPFGVALGDVDGDGDLDLLTANFYDNTVSVRLNNGSGNFTAPATNPNPAVGSSPISVAVGDVDGDGDLDLLTANQGTNTVSVRLNNGSGNFTAPATNPEPAVGNNPLGVALGDVDGDGDLDLLAANNNDNVSVRLNDGSGNFTAPATNPNPTVGSSPQIVAVGDVDGDGDLDLLTANYGNGTVSVRLNNGSGNFTAPATNPDLVIGAGTLYTLALGDVDGDGDLDLLAGTSTKVGVRLNQTPPVSIATGTLAASSYAAGASVTVPFTVSGTFTTGNVFTAQLSDATGSFGAPTSIGTLTGTTSGSISATLPTVIVYGTGYRVRVVGSTPAVIGTDNGSNLTINGAQVAIGTISGTSFASGSALSVPYTAQSTFGAGNVFTAQLSNAAGSFAAPTSIGTVTSGSSGTISATLPAVATTATGYRIRIVSSAPAYTSADNGTNLTITAPTVTTAAISGSPFSAGSSVSVAFSTTGAFGSGNSFTAQLSDAAGSFGAPVTIGTGTASPIAATIPTPVGSGTAYRIRVVASNPAVVGTDNGTNLVVNGSTISTSALGASTYAAGATLSVPFTITGTYSAGNVFTAQLSSAAGSFANPVAIGTLTGTGGGTVSATIPASTAAGTTYRIRVVSSSPAAIGTDNGSNVSITAVPNGLAFDGSDDRVTVADAAGINNFSSGLKFTLECWVKPVNNTSATFINKGGGGGGEQYSLDISGSNVRFYVQSSSGGYTVLQIPSTNTPVNTWTHLAATFDYSQSLMKLYVNGVEKTSSTTPPSTLKSNATGLALGAQANAAQFYNGQLDEVRIWNRALCVAEILNNKDKELAPGQAGLVAYYKMNQGIAGGNNAGITTLADASGSNSPGTLVNFSLANGNTTSNWVAGTVSGVAATPFVENTSSTQTMSGTTTKTFGTSCGDYARITPAGAAPVTGNVTALQRLDASVQSYNSYAYAQRHYDFAAVANPTAATADVTLYFTQAEFDAYNAANSLSADLPTSPTDATGKAALRVTQFHGTPTGGYAPANYPTTWGGSGPAQLTITPGAAAVVWNSAAVRWEVTFPVTGFSGFFVSTDALHVTPNAAPTALALSNSSVAENAGANATVGTFTTTDPDAGNTFTYSLVSGTGSTDNASFTISGNALRLTASADYETQPSYAIRVQTQDQGGLSFVQTFTISITNVLETPTITGVSPGNGPVGTSVTLTGTNFTGGGSTTVRFNGTLASGVSFASATSLSVPVPSGATTGTITVTNADGTGTSASAFTVGLTTLTVSSGTLANPVPVPAGSYATLTVTTNGVGQLTGPITVGTGVSVQAGGTLLTNCQGMTGAGSFTLAAGATLGICDPAGLSATPGTGAVQTTGPLSLSSNASYLYNGPTAQATGTALPSQVRGLTASSAQPLTLSQPLAVAQTLTVAGSGNVALNGQPLTLLSSASGTALVVNSGSGTVTGGTATVQRYLDPSLNPGLGYRHYASPVSGNTLADLATATFTPVFNSAYNTSTAPGTVSPYPTVEGYNQSRLTLPISGLSTFDKGFYSPATGATNVPDAWPLGRGFAVNLAGTELVDFTGTLNNGDYTLPLARNSGATAADAGWQSMGNPYPAPLDWRLVLPADRPNLDGAMYVYESTSQYGGNYRAYNNGVGASPYVASGQGFWVTVSSGQTSGSFNFHNSQRVTDYAVQVPLRRGTADSRPLVQLTLASAGLADDLYVYAEAGATAGADAAFDAVKLPNSTGLNLSAVAATGELQAIAGLPAFAAGTVLPLRLGTPTAGTYTVTATSIANLPAGLTAYLRDAVTGQQTDLRTQPTTSLTLAAGLSTRYSLAFGPAGALATAGGLTAAQVAVYPNPAAHGAGVAIALPTAAGTTATVALCDALGRVVVPARALAVAGGQATGTVPTTGLAPGVYVLRLTAGATVISKRLVVE